MTQRVLVIGCIGAGKSTLARALGQRLHLPVVHLDRLWWHDGSYRIRGRASVQQHTMAPDAWRARQRHLAAADEWIIEGGYVGDLDTRLDRATTVIWLDLPRRVCVWRVLRRHGRKRDDRPPHVQESLRWLAVQVWWVVRYPRRKRPLIEAAIAQHTVDVAVHRLRRRHEVTDLLVELAEGS